MHNFRLIYAPLTPRLAWRWGDTRARAAELAAAAERLGVPDLVKVCERALVHAVGDDASHAAALNEWAKDFNLQRLRKHCAGVLASNTSELG
jgi:hypothetical protein